jgi:hypothetical protein
VEVEVVVPFLSRTQTVLMVVLVAEVPVLQVAAQQHLVKETTVVTVKMLRVPAAISEQAAGVEPELPVGLQRRHQQAVTVWQTASLVHL